MPSAEYAELISTSNFSFLRGASHPEELVISAKQLGYRGLALTDHHSFAGTVRGYLAAKENSLPFFVGTRLELFYSTDFIEQCETLDRLSLIAYPTDRASYGRLSRLLTLGNRRATKGECFLTLDDFLNQAANLIVILLPPYFTSSGFSNIAIQNFTEAAKQIRQSLSADFAPLIALRRNYGNANAAHTDLTKQIADYLQLALIATNDVLYHMTERRALHDLLTCVREKCTLEQAGLRLEQNAERHLKPIAEIAHLFREFPGALRQTIIAAEKLAGFSFAQLSYQYPDEVCPEGRSPLQYLSELCQAGLAERYPSGATDKIHRLLKDELILIAELQYEKYFLTCYDIVRFARSQNILCQGRGSAANSIVCYLLGITSVNPEVIDTLFARFVSKERNEPPDIDIDFEHERREEVIQYIYQKYGRDRAGLTAEVITYRHRSAVRDVGKALGLGETVIDKIAKSIHRWTECTVTAEEISALGLDPDDLTIRNLFYLANELVGFPRHLSQHVGGFVISREPLSETVPIQNAAMPDRTIIEWDKDDIDALKMLKVDCLGLGMLSCIRKALGYINTRHSMNLSLHTIPTEDPRVYQMICEADTVGVFQIESRAQMSMLPRLKPRCFYDLVIEVAIVRPGPIQGKMVHPFLKRRSGREAYHFPDQRVRDVLGKTLGVPIFQEQAMRLAIVLAGFTADEAERLRRAMASWKRNKHAIAQFQHRIVTGMMQNGYTREFAESCVDQIKGFSEYGFPESHAASFALLAYASAWLKFYYPAEFTAALINSQPMGFYAPSQIITDAKNHGVSILPIDINHSEWDCTLVGAELRLGTRLVQGLGKVQAQLLTAAVHANHSFNSIHALWNATKRLAPRLRIASLNALARADAFQSLGLSRREALWQIRALPPEPLPLDEFDESHARTAVSLPKMVKQQEMFADYSATGLSLKAHPLEFIRAELRRDLVSTTAELRALPPYHHRLVSVGGIAIFRQRPPTAKGVLFITLEDETGVANLIIPADIFERHKSIILSSTSLLATGKLEKIGNLAYVATTSLQSLDTRLGTLQKEEMNVRSCSY